MNESVLISLGGDTRCLFPWLGTRSFRTTVKFLQKNAKRLGIARVEFDGCNYITFKCPDEPAAILERIKRISAEDFTAESLLPASSCPVYEKYDPYIPAPLLRKAYSLDKMNVEEMKERFSGE